MLRAIKQRITTGLRPVAHRYGPQRAPLPPAHWGLDHDARGLCLDGLSLHALLQKWGSPLHVVHAERLARNVASLQRASDAGRRCEVYYSYKTNPVPGVLRFLHARGVGAEVISPYELWLALELGVAPSQIVYNGPAKSDASLRTAVERDILLINVNHREETARVAAIAAALGRRPAVGVRVVASGGWSGQFGSPIDTGEAFATFAEAVAAPSLAVKALHAHYGAPIRTAEELTRYVQSVLAFADELHARLGLELEIVDFGGSLAVPSVAALSERERRLNWLFQRPLTPPDVTATLTHEAYARLLLELVERHYQARGRAVPRVFVEPGRALTGDTQTLVASVVTIKEARDGHSYAVLDAGINLAEAARHEYHQLFPANRLGEAPARVYTLTGPICSPGDVLYNSWRLPELRAGDSVAIMDAGAYFVPFATSFSFPQPAIVMVEGGRDTLLRRAETFDDLVALDNGCVAAG